MDREELRARRDQKVARSLKYFGLIMAIFYLMMAGLIAFLPIFTGITQTTRLLMAAMLALYGGFRLYRALRKTES